MRTSGSSSVGIHTLTMFCQQGDTTGREGPGSVTIQEEEPIIPREKKENKNVS